MCYNGINKRLINKDMSLFKTALTFIFILALVVVGINVVIMEEGESSYLVDNKNQSVSNGDLDSTLNLENNSKEVPAENKNFAEEISGETQRNSIQDEIPKINPFKTETNPFKNAYKNPFE